MDSQDAMNEMVDAKHVARVLGVHVRTIRNWVGEGRFPCYRPSSRVIRFRMDEVMESLRAPVGLPPANGEE